MKLKFLLLKMWLIGKPHNTDNIYIDYSKTWDTIESCTNIYHSLASNKMVTAFQRKWSGHNKNVSQILIRDLITNQLTKTNSFL